MFINFHDGTFLKIEDSRGKDIGENWLYNPKEVITIGKMYVASSSIKNITPDELQEEFNLQKNGWWLCKYDRWHEKRQKCQCGYEYSFDPDKGKSVKKPRLTGKPRKIDKKLLTS